MNRPPRWTCAAAGGAPVLLIAGWSVAAARQPAGYDPIRDTISALAARGATDRWIMTAALIGVGGCYALTAWGLGSARPAGRWLLGLGGAATVAVATFPQPLAGNSIAHTVAATAAFAALALWPLAAASPRSPALLRPLPASVATLGLIGLILWFVAEIHGGHRGLAERAAAGAEALWPLAVVLSTAPWVRRRAASTEG